MTDFEKLLAKNGIDPQKTKEETLRAQIKELEDALDILLSGRTEG